MLLSNTGDVGTEESESNEASRADSEALTNSSGSVTSGIESISSLTDVSVKSSHLSNSTSVVRDRAVSINREADGEAAEHTESSESNTVHSGPLEGEEHSDGEANNGNDAGHVAESETIDNVGSSTVEAGFGEVAGGGISVRSVVLSGESDNEAGPETKHNAAVAFPLLGWICNSSEIDVELFGEDVDQGDNSEGHHHSGDDKLLSQFSLNTGAELFIGVDLAKMADKYGQDRGKDTNSSNQKREENSINCFKEFP